MPRRGRSPAPSNKWDVDFRSLETKLLTMPRSTPATRTDFDELMELYMAAHSASALKIARADEDDSAVMEIEEWQYFWQHMYTTRDQELLDQAASDKRNKKRIKALHSHKKFLMSDGMVQLSWEYCFTRKNKWFQGNRVRGGGVPMREVVGFGQKLQNDWRKLSGSLERLLKKAAFTDVVKRENDIVLEDDEKDGDTDADATDNEAEPRSSSRGATTARGESAEEIETRLREEYDARMAVQREDVEATYRSQLEDRQAAEAESKQNYESQLADLQAQVAVLQASTDDTAAANALTQCEREKNALNEGKEALENRVGAQETEISSLQELIGSRDEEITDLKAQLEAAQTAGGDSAQLAAALADCRQSSTNMSEQIERMEKENNDLKQQLESLSSDAERFQSDLETKQTEFDEQTQRIQTLNTQMEQNNKEHNDEIEDLKAQLQAAEAAGGDAARLAADLAESQNENKDLQEEIARLKQENEDFSNRFIDAESELMTQQEECAAHTRDFKDEIERLQLELADKTSDCDTQAAELERVRQEIARLTQANEDAQTQLASIQAELSDQKAQCEIHDLQIREANTDIVRLNKDNSTIMAKLRAVEAQLSQKQAECAAHTTQLEDANNEIEMLKTQVQAAEEAGGEAAQSASAMAELTSQREDLLEKVEKLSQQIEELQRESQEKTNRNVQLEGTIADLTEQLRAAERKLSVTNAELVQAQTELERVQSEQKELQQKISQIERAAEQLKSQYADKIAECDQTHVEKEEFNRMKEEYESMIRDLKSQESTRPSRDVALVVDRPANAGNNDESLDLDRKRKEVERLLIQKAKTQQAEISRLQLEVAAVKRSMAKQREQCKLEHVQSSELDRVVQLQGILVENDDEKMLEAEQQPRVIRVESSDPADTHALKELQRKFDDHVRECQDDHVSRAKYNVVKKRLRASQKQVQNQESRRLIVRAVSHSSDNDLESNLVEKTYLYNDIKCCGMLFCGWGCSCCSWINGPWCGKGVDCCTGCDKFVVL